LKTHKPEFHKDSSKHIKPDEFLCTLTFPLISSLLALRTFMELLTTPLPPGYRLIQNLGVISVTTPIQITQKGVIQSLLERNRNEWSEAYDAFIAAAPRDGTIIFGMQVATAAVVLGTRAFLSVTMTGTVGIHEFEQA
jgi:hypothetical protein